MDIAAKHPVKFKSIRYHWRMDNAVHYDILAFNMEDGTQRLIVQFHHLGLGVEPLRVTVGRFGEHGGHVTQRVQFGLHFVSISLGMGRTRHADDESRHIAHIIIGKFADVNLF